MLLLRIWLFWGLVSLHIIGGATLFRRFFPRESPWFGFLVPSLALILPLNALEHVLALPALVWLLPFTMGISLWSIFAPGLSWKKLILPTTLFLVAFTFTLALRALKPNVLRVSSGTYDLTILSSFLYGANRAAPLRSFPTPHHRQILHVSALRWLGPDSFVPPRCRHGVST